MPDPGAHLWYDRPAGPFTEALPVGNGRLGALVFGGITHDKLVLNEQSLWSGSPQDADRHDAHEALEELRYLLLAGKPVEAQALVMERFICAGAGSGQGQGKSVPFGCYQTLGALETGLATARGRA